MYNIFIKIKNNINGSMLVLSLVAMSLFLVILMGAISLAILQQKLNIQKVASAQAMHVAEAGVNYYRWVLYHDPDDYCNSGAGEICITTIPYGPYGPYSYTDQNDEITGEYELYITPPPSGSTIVTIKSVGWVTDHPNIKRTIEVECGVPSWSTYSTLCDSHIRFGPSTIATGRIHSNGGVRFDGVASNIVSSYLETYIDNDDDTLRFGVNTRDPDGRGTADPQPNGDPPTNLPADNPVIFGAGRSFPVKKISFDLLNEYVSDTLTEAESGGIVLEHSGEEGYHIVFTAHATGPNNDTIEIRKVDTQWPSCYSDSDSIRDYIPDATFFMTTTTPPNGIIFVKDTVWIDGTIEDEKMTILAFENPIAGNISDIIINEDLLYTRKDGSDAIGLIAQRGIKVGLYSANYLEIDAAIIAKEGKAGRNHFSNGCGPTGIEWERAELKIYGSIATKKRYGFAYVWLFSGAFASGYHIRDLEFDANLTFGPPPFFPTTGEYTFISWKEK